MLAKYNAIFFFEFYFQSQEFDTKVGEIICGDCRLGMIAIEW
jgi:hypothetical protein